MSEWKDFYEIRASEGRGKPKYMRDWSGRLDTFIKFNEQDISQNGGGVSHEVAAAMADAIFRSYVAIKNSKTTEIYTHLAILSDRKQNKTK